MEFWKELFQAYVEVSRPSIYYQVERIDKDPKAISCLVHCDAIVHTTDVKNSSLPKEMKVGLFLTWK